MDWLGKILLILTPPQAQCLLELVGIEAADHIAADPDERHPTATEHQIAAFCANALLNVIAGVADAVSSEELLERLTIGAPRGDEDLNWRRALLAVVCSDN